MCNEARSILAKYRSDMWRIARALFISPLLVVASACATNQQVAFAPSIATVTDGGKGVMAIQGRVSESPDSQKRKWLIDNFPLHIKPDPDRGLSTISRPGRPFLVRQ